MALAVRAAIMIIMVVMMKGNDRAAGRELGVHGLSRGTATEAMKATTRFARSYVLAALLRLNKEGIAPELVGIFPPQIS